MDSEDLSFAVFLSLFIGALGVSFYAGKWFEDRRWRGLLPAQMEMLCSECAGLKGAVNANN